MTSHSKTMIEELSGSVTPGPRTIQVYPFDGPDWVPAFVGWWAQVLQATAQDDFQDTEHIKAGSMGGARSPQGGL